MDKVSSKKSNELLDQFILNMDKAISKKIIIQNKGFWFKQSKKSFNSIININTIFTVWVWKV